MPEIPEGYCAEYDPVVLPGEREIQMRLIDEQGRPVARANVEGRLTTTIHPLEGLFANEPVPIPATTDEDGLANLRVFPGRPYRLMAAAKGGETAIKRDWTFTGPGPHEWRIAETGK
jgi:hypothetical protein